MSEQQAQTSAPPRKHEGPPKAERRTCVACRMSAPAPIVVSTALGDACANRVACRKRQAKLAKAS